MGQQFENCWEIMHCGREPGGDKVDEFGVCSAARENMGHSCWAVPHTLCGGFPEHSVDEKQEDCMSCEVFMRYHRQIGFEGEYMAEEFPEEERKYLSLLRRRIRPRL